LFINGQLSIRVGLAVDLLIGIAHKYPASPKRDAADGTDRAVACPNGLFRKPLCRRGWARKQDHVDTTHPERWFALRVKPHRERVVAAAARHKGFEEFLPLFKCRRRWSDRLKVLELPLFPGYVFCRLSEEDRFGLLTIPGVVHLVSNGRVPLPIDDGEISALQTAIRSEIPVEPWPFLEVGERVKLSRGPLAGLEGFLVQVHDRQRVVVGLAVLKRSVAVEVEREWVEPMARAGQAVAVSLSANLRASGT